MIMVFDERGKYVETVHSDLYASAMEYVDNEVMAFNVFARYPDFVEPYCGASFVVKDKDMGIRYLFAKTGLDNSFSYSRYYNLYSYDNRVYCNVNFEDFIFELKPDGVKARYRILFGPENVSNHAFETEEQYYKLKAQYPYFEGEFMELDDYTYLMFRGQNGRELFHKHSTKETFALSTGFNDPMTAFFRRPLARYGDRTMVCALPVSEVLACRGILSGPSVNAEEIKKLYSTINVDSNPVLFFYEVVF